MNDNINDQVTGKATGKATGKMPGDLPNKQADKPADKQADKPASKSKRKLWLTSIAVVIAFSYWIGMRLSKKEQAKSQVTAQQIETLSYWTCPMHPQIHSDKAGECPICHMKLVQINGVEAHSTQLKEDEQRSVVVASPYQRQLLGIQKVQAEKMDLTARISISGHLTSATSIAFQLYEGDLRYIRPGLNFRGESSFAPETEILGQITSIDSIVDPTSRTIRVVGQIKKGPHGLISETTFRGEIEIQLKGVIAIPESSVLHTGSGSLVYVVHDDGTMMAHKVKLGQKAESYYEVVDGLTAGQMISSGPNFLIDSEAKIRGSSGGASGHANH